MLEFIARLVVAAAFGGLLVVLLVVLRAYIAYRWSMFGAPYHVVRSAWHAARYPGGVRAAADMLRDERVLHVQASIAARLCESGCETCGEFVRVAALRDRLRL